MGHHDHLHPSKRGMEHQPPTPPTKDMGIEMDKDKTSSIVRGHLMDLANDWSGDETSVSTEKATAMILPTSTETEASMIPPTPTKYEACMNRQKLANTKKNNIKNSQPESQSQYWIFLFPQSHQEGKFSELLLMMVLPQCRLKEDVGEWHEYVGLPQERNVKQSQIHPLTSSELRLSLLYSSSGTNHNRDVPIGLSYS